MTRNDAISRLRQSADTMKDMGATALFLYGSTARDEAQATSDLDLFIDYEPGSRFSLLDLGGMKQFLEEELAMDVDITTPEHPMLRDGIERSVVRIF